MIPKDKDMTDVAFWPVWWFVLEGWMCRNMEDAPFHTPDMANENCVLTNDLNL